MNNTNNKNPNEEASGSYSPPVLRAASEAAAAAEEDEMDLQTSASTDSALQGGRLWKLAGEQVQVSVCAPAEEEEEEEEEEEASFPATTSYPATTERRKGVGLPWAETFMERTRSRADPDMAPVTHPNGKQSMVRLEDEEYLRDTGLAQRRVKVAQLLIAGILGILVGWLGNAVVGTSCHFASVQVQVGQSNDMFSLHFGLYKYSTVDSSLNGYVRIADWSL
jgi:hypothetical protein